eukprot:1907221-Pyramimonas_sp.AAC.1
MSAASGARSASQIYMECQFLAGAHLMEAAYQAYEEVGDTSQQVKFSIESGMPNCSILRVNTPDDAMTWFVDDLNDLNAIASGISFLAGYKTVPKISAGWIGSRKKPKPGKKHVSADGDDGEAATGTTGTAAENRFAGLETQHWEYITKSFPKYKPVYGGFIGFKAARAFFNAMAPKQSNLWDQYEAQVNKTCNFMHGELSASSVYHVNNEIYNIITTHCGGKNLSKSHAAYLIEVLMFALPRDAARTGPHCDWLFRDVNAVKETVKKLCAPMENSKTFRAEPVPDDDFDFNVGPVASLFKGSQKEAAPPPRKRCRMLGPDRPIDHRAMGPGSDLRGPRSS